MVAARIAAEEILRAQAKALVASGEMTDGQMAELLGPACFSCGEPAVTEIPEDTDFGVVMAPVCAECAR